MMDVKGTEIAIKMEVLRTVNLHEYHCSTVCMLPCHGIMIYCESSVFWWFCIIDYTSVFHLNMRETL